MTTFSRAKRLRPESYELGVTETDDAAVQANKRMRPSLPPAGVSTSTAANKPGGSLHFVDKVTANTMRHIQTTIRPSARRSNMYMTPRLLHFGGTGPFVPAGLVNLGNSCYLNAVLQSLFCLPNFASAVNAAMNVCREQVGADGVMPALDACVKKARSSTETSCLERNAFSPEELKLAVARRSVSFQGSIQQDAHEFFCELLEAAQDEVLQAETARLGRHQVRVTETANIATRVFGFAVEHQMTCNACGKVACVTEQFTHLSLDLPAEKANAVVALGVPAMLKAFFTDETIEKQCEGCGAAAVKHTIRHAFKRLPQVLVLHIKRFNTTFDAGNQGIQCSKLQQRVSIPMVLCVGQFATKNALPPLPLAAEQQENVESNRGATVEQQAHVQKRFNNFYTTDLCSSLLTPGRRPGGAAQPDFWDARAPRRTKGEMPFETLLEAADELEEELQVALEQSRHEDKANQQAAREAADLETAIKRSLKEQQCPAQSCLNSDIQEAGLDAAVKRSLQELQEEEGQANVRNENNTAPPSRTVPSKKCIPEVIEDDVPLDSAGGTDTTIGHRPSTIRSTESPLGKYRLAAVIMHHGNRVESGHFTTDARDHTTGIWHRYNDSRVHRITEGVAIDEAKERNCYMLMYTAE